MTTNKWYHIEHIINGDIIRFSNKYKKVEDVWKMLRGMISNEEWNARIGEFRIIVIMEETLQLAPPLGSHAD